ncbi:Ubiquitin carboxyl-terminal hydrolase 27 [Morus notabilis]|uniref:ubiquitinyl hydrolase 1 n=1 Tax=Morus notabilis TaxID=981085 RepID=W9R1T9_9ROSA|nr:Ubiquitin carboxyl-terminal hydrolase 27 [Morus notabilis]
MQRNPNQNDLIHQFKHGYWKNLVSDCGFRISVAGILGIAGFVLALIKDGKLGKLSGFNWLSKIQDSPRSLRLVPGLQNLGNNCFLNVILQALASCSCFQIFLQKAIEECERSADEDLVDSMPLAVALASLFEELCVVGEGRVALSPRTVMLAIAHYIPSFNLTAQQDAAEAFLHILSSLREEFTGCYDPRNPSLLELCSSSCRIITPKRGEVLSKQEMWQRAFVGPFDGVLGSILTCQSCSSQISLNFEAFHSLPLSPVLDTGATIMVRCSLENCLKQFTVAEQVENYHCSNCWHIAGIKYLSSIRGNEADIEKLRICTEQDSCDCRRIFCFPWSNKFSYTLKQISIARSPKILCIHLKRVSVNIFGELVKLQGHVSFPLILDLSSFMTSGVAFMTREEIFQRGQVHPHYGKPSFHTEISNIQYDTTRNLTYMYPATRGGFYSSKGQDLPWQSDFIEAGACSKALHTDIEMQPDEQILCIHLKRVSVNIFGELVKLQILCIHLKRVSVNIFGELVKLQGHVSFPLILDLSSFMTSGVAFMTREEIFQRGQVHPHYGKPSFHTEISNIQYDTTRNLTYMYPATRGGFYSSKGQDLPWQSDFIEAGACSKALHTDIEMQPDEQFQLWSTMEGLAAGHYTVYSSAKDGSDSFKDEIDTPSEPDPECWFCISDSEVHRVSEKDVLAAEASLLFYEKIVQE